ARARRGAGTVVAPTGQNCDDHARPERPCLHCEYLASAQMVNNEWADQNMRTPPVSPTAIHGLFIIASGILGLRGPVRSETQRDVPYTASSPRCTRENADCLGRSTRGGPARAVPHRRRK